ncbi:MAG TPA: molybdenum cofactor biosynthesis protein MoaE [Caulobacteraceae bacterium]
MIRLTEQPFDPGAELNGFCRDRLGVGAVASFLGIARGEPGQASALELEAYPLFTQNEIAKIVASAVDRFGLHDVAVIHRIGAIPPGEAIVLVITASAHRREAFEACDFLMDYLKSRAPFWKREFGPAGPRWVEPTAGDLADIARWDRDAPRGGKTAGAAATNE